MVSSLIRTGRSICSIMNRYPWKLHCVLVNKVHHTDLHVPVQTIADDEVMGHTDAMRLHWVSVSIIEVSYLWIIIV